MTQKEIADLLREHAAAIDGLSGLNRSQLEELEEAAESVGDTITDVSEADYQSEEDEEE